MQVCKMREQIAAVENVVQRFNSVFQNDGFIGDDQPE